MAEYEFLKPEEQSQPEAGHPSNVCPRCTKAIDEHFWDRIGGIDVASCRNGLPLNPPKLDRPPWQGAEPNA